MRYCTNNNWNVNDALIFLIFYLSFSLFSEAFQCSDTNGTNGTADEMEMVFLNGILENPAVTQRFKVSALASAFFLNAICIRVLWRMERNETDTSQIRD